MTDATYSSVSVIFDAQLADNENFLADLGDYIKNCLAAGHVPDTFKCPTCREYVGYLESLHLIRNAAHVEESRHNA